MVPRDFLVSVRAFCTKRAVQQLSNVPQRANKKQIGTAGTSWLLLLMVGVIHSQYNDQPYDFSRPALLTRVNGQCLFVLLESHRFAHRILLPNVCVTNPK